MTTKLFFPRLVAKSFSVISAFLVSYAASVSLSFAQQGNSLNNPLQVNGIAQFVALALKVLVMVALPLITLYFVYAGYLFIRAQGNPGKLDEAKSNFFYAIIGALLILGAWVIATLIGGTVTQLLAS